MASCRFCQIAAGERPERIVYEDETAIAFEDARPVMPVHILVIPKRHVSSLSDGLPDEEIGHLFNVAAQVAKLTGIDESGYRVVVNTGSDAQQTVFHLHIHVLGGAKMNIDSPREPQG